VGEKLHDAKQIKALSCATVVREAWYQEATK